MSVTLPLVSVCIPTYNGATFLDRAIASLQRSTYPHLETIVSDDGSTDGTLDAIRAAPLPNLRLFQHDRSGLAANWNFCWQQARGTFVKFLFQDDEIAPDCIARLVAAATPRVGLVFCARQLVSDRPIARRDFPAALHAGWSRLRSLQSGRELLADPRLFEHPHNKFGEPTCTLIRRDAGAAIGYFDPQLHQYLDLDLWYRLASRYDVAFVDAPLATFRLHPEQATQRQRHQSRAEIYRVWHKLLANPDLPGEFRRVLRRRYRRHLAIAATKHLLRGRWGDLQTLYRLPSAPDRGD